jgi:hypothetical protein
LKSRGKAIIARMQKIMMAPIILNMIFNPLRMVMCSVHYNER